jgi:hypothetical protein
VTSTKARRQPDLAAAPAAPGVHVGPFFLIVALSVSIIAFLVLRGQPLAALTLIAITLVGAGLTAAAMYRTVAPLGGALPEDAAMVGGRTRAALERDKALTLRAIKELEFDRAMGKVSDADYAEMRDRLRARAVRLMTQLDGAAMYRAQIERDALDAAGSMAAASACAAGGAGCGVRRAERTARRRADARSSAHARSGDSGGGVARWKRHGSRRARVGRQQRGGRPGGTARRGRRPAVDDRR